MNPRGALEQYSAINVQTGVVDADPHRLIQMLLDGALERLALSKGHVEREEWPALGEKVSKVISIIGGLQASLNMEAGGEVAENLDNLYDYMVRRLLAVHSERNAKPLDEVSALLREIKAGWDGIRKEVLEQAQTAAAS